MIREKLFNKSQGHDNASLVVTTTAVKSMPGLTTQDRLEIQELNARHFYALDGLNLLLPGDPAEHWADTFTPDGTFEIHNANGDKLLSVSGREQLVEAQRQFPDIAATRHWAGELLIESHLEGAKSACYIIALNISIVPAPIIRCGTYYDLLTKIHESWKFKSKILILDQFSPSAV
jgi:hypothetical protein